MSAASLLPAAGLRLWERFQSGRCSDEELVRNVTLKRWMRCREAGLSAENSGAPVMSLAGLGAALESFSHVLAPGAPFDAFATTLAQAGFCGIFCDASGAIIARKIAEPFESTVAETRLVEGAVWSERARGTNGMGTALVEGVPVSVVGAEHFERRNHGLACYAAPIRDVREQTVAVLDASGPVTSAAGFIQSAVVATAAAIEALIVARTYDAAIPGGLFELERLLARLPHASLLVEMTGRVRRANTRYRELPDTPTQGALARLVRSSFAPGRGQVPLTTEDLPAALRGLAIEVEPIGRPESPVAALIHMRPRSRRGHAAAARVEEAFQAIVGSDPAIVSAREQAARFARTELPILLLAETGAGKEIFARAIHAGSARSGAPFVAVNCGALAGSLLESELFGYAPGAFTGAAAGGRFGKLAAAHGGTLFLDEIGEMSTPAQAAMLRFLEDGTYYRVGEHTERRADVRLIAATSRDLPALLAQGSFRSDLYFRMRGVVLRLPPLRDRGDRGELAQALLDTIARQRGLPSPMQISPAALAWIERHGWPGNVRELRSTLEYAVVLAADAPRIELWHLPIEESPEPAARGRIRATSERSGLLQALHESRGNMSGAARSLGVARSTLYRMLDRHRLRAPGDR